MNGPNQLTPFYQSLANKGMKNTNNNVANENMPNNINQGAPNLNQGNPQFDYGFSNNTLRDGSIDFGGLGQGNQPPSGDMGGSYIPSFDQNNDGVVDVFDMMIASQMDTSSMTPQEYEQFMASLAQYIQGQGGLVPDINSQFPTISPSEFTGGGGIAGSLAKQLYYPSTSGGFSSVGSGISGSTLEELLNRTR